MNRDYFGLAGGTGTGAAAGVATGVGAAVGVVETEADGSDFPAPEISFNFIWACFTSWESGSRLAAWDRILRSLSLSPFSSYRRAAEM